MLGGLFPPWRASRVTAGCEARGSSRRASCSIQEATGEGKTGRVNVSEPSLLPRHRRDPRMGCFSGSRRTGRCEAAGAGRERRSGRMSTAVPGSRGHPLRSHLACAERGNPDGVRHGTVGSSTVVVGGGLTVRKAEIPSGRRMTREANAGGRKATGNRDSMARLPLAVLDNWPDRDAMSWPERALTRVG